MKNGLSRRSLLQGMAATTVVMASGTLAGATRVLAQTATDGVATIVIENEPSKMLCLTDLASTIVSPKVTEGLLEYDDDLRPQPLLATAWEVSEDGLTYTFTLREGVKWHDGADFSSADVKFSIEALKQHHSRGRQTFAQLESIDTPDAHTVVLKLARPTPFLLTALASCESPIVPAHVYGDADPVNHPNETAPIGTGPFVFREWSRGSHVVWERNPNYWDPDFPKLERLVARFIPDAQARTVALESGDVQLGYRTPVPVNELRRLEQLATLAFERRGYSYNPPNIHLLNFNTTHEILKDVRVRQAIAHCIDRDAIVKIVYQGAALPSASPVGPYHREFHNPAPSPYPFDLAKAEALLDEAGYPRQADGKRLAFTMEATGNEQRTLTDYVKAVLAQVGIDITVRAQDLSTLAKRIFTDQDYAMQMGGSSNLFDPQVGVQRLFWSKNIVKGLPFSNGTFYSNPEVDALLEAAAIDTDRAKRVEQWMKVQEIVMREVPCIPIASPDWVTISAADFKDHTTSGEGFESSLRKSYFAAA